MCEVTPPVSVELPLDARAAARARRLVEEAHCDAHGADVLDSAKLLVSEVVANAVRHGSPPITIEVVCTGHSGLEVRVSDGDENAPVVRDADPEAEAGRGIALVDMLSDAWGVEPRQPGKAVWFRVRP